MRKYILIILMICGWANTTYSQQQLPFIIKGKIIGQDSGFVKLSYSLGNGKNIQDSSALKNGTFEFSGYLFGPTMAKIQGKLKSRSVDDPNFAYIFLEPGDLNIESAAGNLKNLQLKGSKTQDEMTALEMLKAPITKEYKPIYDDYQKANEVYIQAKKDKRPADEIELLKEKTTALKNQLDPINERSNKVNINFIETHPKSYYAAYLLRWKVASIPLETSIKYYDALSSEIKQSNIGKEILREIKSLQGGSTGSTASLFSTKDINGEQLNLTDFKGKKYVLLDFWASWCVPCRKGNPHLLSLYSKYKDKGLEIIGISDDDSNQEAWRKAVDQDKISIWKHVLRGSRKTNTGYDKSADTHVGYSIQMLPTKILIDMNGMIIGRYGGGGDTDEAMDKKLAEIFN